MIGDKLKLPYLLILIIAIGAFLRFYKLDWGEGLFTHPDEYHIVASVNQLSFPNQMHPHFFSYGTVTIYLIYFTQELIASLSSILNSEFLILNSFIVGRFYSALFSTLTILVVYKICRAFLTTKLSLLAAFFVALTPGLIQQAHFATPESAQFFFLFSSLFFMLKFVQANKLLHLSLASVFLGLSLGVKISSIVFLLPLAASIILATYSKRHSGLSRISLNRWRFWMPPRFALSYQNDGEGFKFFRKPFRLMMLTLTSLIITTVTFALVTPYVFLDFPAFLSNLEYEGGLAIGKTPVFYTRQFIDTIPILFQIEKIFPYALGSTLLIFGILGFVFLFINILIAYFSSGAKRSRETSNATTKQFNNENSSRQARTINLWSIHILIIVAFLSLFFPNAFLFAKWTRFIAPAFPFFAIFAGFFVQVVANKTGRSVYYFLIGFMIITTALWTTAFSSIYLNPDVRITASKWLEDNSKHGSTFLVEGGNTIDLPLKGDFKKISLDFYSLENDPITREKIADALYSSDYFLIQSRRVFMNHQKLPNMFPKTVKLYDKLFNGELRFRQIKQFHSYPKLSFFGLNIEFPDENAEETWSVFDHPVIRVFKKINHLPGGEYEKLF